MTVKTYNSVVRDFVNMADAVNRARSAQAYDYAHNGGHNGGHNRDVQSGVHARTARLPIDVWANEEAFFIAANLPGLNVNDVEISFEGETLAIGGSYPVGDEEVEFVKRELYHGKFERSLTFNVPIDVDGIEAALDNGVLTLTVPKAEEIRPKRIQVQAK